MMNSDMYEDQFSSKYMFGIPVMGIDIDGSVVIDGHRTHTDVRDLSIESAGVLVLPFNDPNISLGAMTSQYEEIVFGDFDNFITPDNTRFEPTILDEREEKCNQEIIDDISRHNENQKNKIARRLNRKSLTRNQYKCMQCFKEFSRKIELNSHKLIHESIHKHKCGICEKSFSQQSNLWKHIRSHTGERPFKCSVCDKAFTQLANLQKHNLVHTGEKPFSCPVCRKEFSQQANMLKHQILHTGERPFVCNVCPKSFTQKSNLAKHELLHLGARPYTCKICCKSFTQQANLKKHQCHHYDSLPYCCKFCEKRYVQKISLDRHKRRCRANLQQPSQGDNIQTDADITDKFFTIIDIKEEILQQTSETS